MMEYVLIAVFAGLVLWCPLGWWVAVQKGRDPSEGVVLGLIFGPFGVLILALMPARERPAKPEAEAGGGLTHEEWFQASLLKAKREHGERKEREARRRAERDAYLAALPGRLWSGLGDVGQPIFIGLLVTAPVLVALALLLGGGE